MSQLDAASASGFAISDGSEPENDGCKEYRD